MESKKIVNIDSKKSNGNFKLVNDEGYFEERYYTEDIYDYKKFKKMVRNIRSQIRRSKEYKRYVKYLKEEIGLFRCAFLGKVEDTDAEIEFHHYPFSIYDIVSIVLADKLSGESLVSTIKVIDEVLRLHYLNEVGIVPLSKTVHELAHSGEVFINLNQVFGDVSSFVEKYKRGINDDQIKKLNRLIEMSEENIDYTDKDILDIKKVSWNVQENEPLEGNEV